MAAVSQFPSFSGRPLLGDSLPLRTSFITRADTPVRIGLNSSPIGGTLCTPRVCLPKEIKFNLPGSAVAAAHAVDYTIFRLTPDMLSFACGENFREGLALDLLIAEVTLGGSVADPVSDWLFGSLAPYCFLYWMMRNDRCLQSKTNTEEFVFIFDPPDDRPPDPKEVAQQLRPRITQFQKDDESAWAAAVRDELTEPSSDVYLFATRVLYYALGSLRFRFNCKGGRLSTLYPCSDAVALWKYVVEGMQIKWADQWYVDVARNWQNALFTLNPIDEATRASLTAFHSTGWRVAPLEMSFAYRGSGLACQSLVRLERRVLTAAARTAAKKRSRPDDQSALPFKRQRVEASSLSSQPCTREDTLSDNDDKEKPAVVSDAHPRQLPLLLSHCAGHILVRSWTSATTAVNWKHLSQQAVADITGEFKDWKLVNDVSHRSQLFQQAALLPCNRILPRSPERGRKTVHDETGLFFPTRSPGELPVIQLQFDRVRIFVALMKRVAFMLMLVKPVICQMHQQLLLARLPASATAGRLSARREDWPSITEGLAREKQSRHANMMTWRELLVMSVLVLDLVRHPALCLADLAGFQLYSHPMLIRTDTAAAAAATTTTTASSIASGSMGPALDLFYSNPDDIDWRFAPDGRQNEIMACEPVFGSTLGNGSVVRCRTIYSSAPRPSLPPPSPVSVVMPVIAGETKLVQAKPSEWVKGGIYYRSDRVALSEEEYALLSQPPLDLKQSSVFETFERLCILCCATNGVYPDQAHRETMQLHKITDIAMYVARFRIDYLEFVRQSWRQMADQEARPQAVVSTRKGLVPAAVQKTRVAYLDRFVGMFRTENPAVEAARAFHKRFIESKSQLLEQFKRIKDVFASVDSTVLNQPELKTLRCDLQKLVASDQSVDSLDLFGVDEEILNTYKALGSGLLM